MRNSRRPWLVRYWFYIPLLLTGGLSLIVMGLLLDNDLLDLYGLRLAIPLLLLNGMPAILGLFIHAFVASRRDSAVSHQGKPAYKRDRPTRLINIEDLNERESQ
jgi:hypothetical protein